MNVYDIMDKLLFAQLIRKQEIVAVSREERAMDSMIVSALPMNPQYQNVERKKLFDEAKVIRKQVEKAQEDGATGYEGLNGFPMLRKSILISASTCKAHRNYREETEKQMRELARELPVFEWVKTVKGFSDLGLAVISAEARIPVGEYRTVSGFWKHMALSVENGKAQKLPKAGEVKVVGEVYNARRRAEIWAFIDDTMLKHQWAGAKDADGKNPALTKQPVAVPAHATGPYGEIYGSRKAYTFPRVEATEHLKPKDPAKWTLARCDRDARRIMAKALLKDLWVEWRAAA
jgi:hypothetical protein